MHYIYALRTRGVCGYLSVFYVGATKLSLAHRLRLHRRRFGDVETVLLQTVNTEEARHQMEQQWIAYYRQIGAPLVNKADGGPGCTGFVMPVEQKERMAKVGRTNKGRAPWNKGTARPKCGAVRTAPETAVRK